MLRGSEGDDGNFPSNNELAQECLSLHYRSHKMSINVENKQTLHSIIGGMTSDYFDFFCKECGTHLDRVDFYGLDIVGVRLMAKCSSCTSVSIFKVKCSIPLGPIQFTVEKGRNGFKAYDQRKLKSYKRAIEEKTRSKL